MYKRTKGKLSKHVIICYLVAVGVLYTIGMWLVLLAHSLLRNVHLNRSILEDASSLGFGALMVSTLEVNDCPITAARSPDAAFVRVPLESQDRLLDAIGTGTVTASLPVIHPSTAC